MYFWATKASNKQTQLQTGLSNHTINDAFACLREICGRYLQENPIQLGGPGKIVQVDESQFSHTPKHHRCRAPEIPFWVFGIVDTSFKPSVGFMEIVENPGAEILLPIIQYVVRPGSIVHSDEWRSYRQIQGQTGLSHRTVNQSIKFVEPITGVHTQNIEFYWNVKKFLIEKCKVASENYCTGTFKNICGEIVSIEKTMLLIMLLGLSTYSTNFELFSAVSLCAGGGGGDCSLGQFGGEILHLIRRFLWRNLQFKSLCWRCHCWETSGSAHNLQ